VKEIAMALVDRVKNILLTPSSEWNVIAEEPASSGGLLSGYVVPLAGISALAGFIGMTVVGVSTLFFGTYRMSVMGGLGLAVFTFVGAVLGVVILSLVINALAPSFGAEKNSVQAMKVAVYSYTPAWIAGVLRILPPLSILAILGAFYGIYLMYLGLPKLMKSPPDRTVGYTAVTVICALIISVVVSFTGAMFVGAGAVAGGALTGAAGGLGAGSAAADVQYDKDSALGRLQQLGKAMEESNKKIEDAGKRGDSAAQVNAAMEGLGALFGGGRRIDPLSIDQLKAFVPESFAGLPRTRFENERNGFAGLMVTHSQATYSNAAGKRIELDIADSGGASGLVGLASWAQVQSSKESDDGRERTYRENNRMTMEKDLKDGEDEFSTILGERFVVTAKGNGVELAELKRAVAALSLDKLEALKNEGVK
jgi:hypothetical protein